MEAKNLNLVNDRKQVMTRMFNFQGHEVRAVMVNGEQDALFSLADVCDCCELTNPAHVSKLIRTRFVKGGTYCVPPFEGETKGGMKYMTPFNGGAQCASPLENMTTNYVGINSKVTPNCGDTLSSSDLDHELAEIEAYSEQLRVKENAAFPAYENPEHKSDDVISSYLVETAGGLQPALFITEPQLYFVMFRGRSEMAKAFSLWVCSEVLPSIRTKGYYTRPGIELVSLPPVPQPDALGHYNVTYPAVLKDVAARYHMSDNGLKLIQWAVERAKAQGYAQAKSKERELESKVKKATADVAKLTKELKEMQRNAQKIQAVPDADFEEAWDEAQEELARAKKKLAWYEQATRILLAPNASASEKKLIRATIDCLI